MSEDTRQTSATPLPGKPLDEGKHILPSDAAATGSVTIVVKGQSGEQFQITSPTAQLETIGELLRGKNRGSGVRTLIISILASTATIVLSGAIAAGFQYVSWANSVIVANANDRVTKAHDAFVEAVNAIGDRYMASRNFVAALQELASYQATDNEAAISHASNPQTVNSQTVNDGNLTKMAMELDHARLTDYYDKITQWKVGYNALLVKIDYDLDRRIFLLAGTNPGNPVSITKTNNVKCKGYVTEQMRQVGYEQHSLKAQFAVINFCFESIYNAMETLENKIKSDKSYKLDSTTKKTVDDSLDDLNTTTNTFQCYAKQRQGFYVSQIGESVLNPITLAKLFFYEHVHGNAYVRDYLHKQQMKAALDNLTSEDEQCDPTYKAEVKS